MKSRGCEEVELGSVIAHKRLHSIIRCAASPSESNTEKRSRPDALLITPYENAHRNMNGRRYIIGVTPCITRADDSSRAIYRRACAMYDTRILCVAAIGSRHAVYVPLI
ncbi:hypothetical protein EVAR_39695_1 [Eumeta japonica]|uniref:Uncharacterized protein n=1 Tax=Eumeta variegata TaxID=151549 RepID=A0A4C1W4Q6_EUMVA|nr:hypothetical protein EVAR_39695_1 [Eumeta japonica]